MCQGEPDLSGARACAGCHEFQFPDGSSRRRPELMQSTVAEHQQWTASGLDLLPASRTCIDCHMPRTAAGHRSHRFLAGHDEATLRQSLIVQVHREPEAIVLTLIPNQVGHALPTGDLFRRIAVEVEPDTVTSQAAPRTQYLARRFASEQQVPGRWVRVTRQDTRLFGPRELRFPVSGPAPVRYRIRYERVAFPKDLRGGPAVLDGTIELASGLVP